VLLYDTNKEKYISGISPVDEPITYIRLGEKPAPHIPVAAHPRGLQQDGDKYFFISGQAITYSRIVTKYCFWRVNKIATGTYIFELVENLSDKYKYFVHSAHPEEDTKGHKLEGFRPYVGEFHQSFTILENGLLNTYGPPPFIKVMPATLGLKGLRDRESGRPSLRTSALPSVRPVLKRTRPVSSASSSRSSSSRNSSSRSSSSRNSSSRSSPSTSSRSSSRSSSSRSFPSTSSPQRKRVRLNSP
jgi:hypothetical protein